jgi:hypothetical protein
MFWVNASFVLVEWARAAGKCSGRLLPIQRPFVEEKVDRAWSLPRPSTAQFRQFKL